ncbi:long-chain fatty acid--CoA ligase [Parasphingopyxis sp.]|uniref:AMP-dependent synthetase/ligase n=1 Tax=Parasphingopyxis sp. TaxID=1920299 RepID=UPI0026241EDD|nr:long-chain fatty acid--CoA ligase [Parasphingopyxis sp.]
MRQLEIFPNLLTMFFTRVREKGDQPFLWRHGENGWESMSWREVAEQACALADALQRLGLQRGDRVVLVSENRPEFCIADLGIMAAGCIAVPTYTTNTERDHTHILEDSRAKAVIVSTQKLAKTVTSAALNATHCKSIIGIEPMRMAQGGDVQFHDWSSLLGAETPDIEARAEACDFAREDTACIIYTSGTGGAPRGVMQHHGAILHNCEGCAAVISEDFGWKDEVFLSFLPLSHAYEHSAGQFFPIGLGGQIYYSRGLDKLAADILETKPTIMVVVPRLFEVLRQRLLKTIEKQGKFPNYMLQKALDIGEKDYAGSVPLRDKPMDVLLDVILRPKIRKRFGGRLKALVSGGAPLNPEIGIFFHSLGLTLLQGYGQTEAAPVISCNRPKTGLKMDTVGPPLPKTEVKIAEDGEILVKGELVMHGYWRNEEETARVLKDGWLHTGDIGHIDEAGRIAITDRKKDLIVNDKGDNVAPQRVEGMLTLEPEISQAMVVGDQRPHLVGLIVPDPEWVREWAQANGVPNDEVALRDNPDFHRAVSAAVDRVNKGLAAVEKVRRTILADEAFTVENDQMTPSMKIRRHVLREIYGERLNALYRH